MARPCSASSAPSTSSPPPPAMAPWWALPWRPRRRWTASTPRCSNSAAATRAPPAPGALKDRPTWPTPGTWTATSCARCATFEGLTPNSAGRDGKQGIQRGARPRGGLAPRRGSGLGVRLAQDGVHRILQVQLFLLEGLDLHLGAVLDMGLHVLDALVEGVVLLEELVEVGIAGLQFGDQVAVFRKHGNSSVSWGRIVGTAPMWGRQSLA